MVGAPGVNEGNLPSIDVGAPGKIAMVYYGSENAPGNYKKNPPAKKYEHTTWNGYMTITTNVFASNPVFYSGTVNAKSDPLIRRECGPGRCGAVYDFIDVEIGPDGTTWASFVDGCTQICATPDGTADAGSEGLVGSLTGVRLR
jgi:hypothetical protein